MTVVVGVLNKKGIAIAADSAVTNQVRTISASGEISDEKEKIVNSGNKMLRISDVIPVSAMIVNNANLLGVPWDVIIRWYRKQRGKTEFSSVEELVKDFLDFIPEQDFFIVNSFKKNWPYTTELVFSGYGTDQGYPQLIYLKINGVENSQLIFGKKDLVIHTISEENPSTIQYFGQIEIAATLTENALENEEVNALYLRMSEIFTSTTKLLTKKGLIKTSTPNFNFGGKFLSIMDNYHKDERKRWIEVVQDYSLQQMAALAENLINATELYQQITFEKEHVGGLIDLAVITKVDGFQWLNRKSWYTPSRGGQYGKFGI